MADIPEIVEALKSGKRVERLVLPPNDFDEATAGPPLPIPAPGSMAASIGGGGGDSSASGKTG
jgi:hypothetical protein